jgi:hypothetical protein
MVYDALHLAAIDVEFAGCRPLTVVGVVPRPYCLLQARFIWRVVGRNRHRMIHKRGRDRLSAGRARWS